MNTFSLICAGSGLVVGSCAVSVLAQELLLESETTVDSGGAVDHITEIVSSNDGVVVSAGVYGTSPGDSMLVTRVGRGGDVWSYDIAAGPEESGDMKAGEVVVAQGGAVVGASRFRPLSAAASNELRVFRIDDDGTLEWMIGIPGDWYSATPGTEDANRGEHPQVAAVNDGSIVVACTEGTLTGDFSAGVVRLDQSGSLLWESTVTETGFNHKLQDVAVSPDGSIRISGARYGNVNGYPQSLFMAKLLSDGSLDWIRTVEPGPVGSVFAEFEGTTAHVDANGDAVLVGSVESNCGLFAIKLARFDEQGNMLWVDEIPDAICDSLKILRTHMRSDGSMIVVCRGNLDPQSRTVAAFSWAVDGTREWVVSLPGASPSASSGGSAVDACGNTLIWGAPFSPSGCNDYVFMSIDRYAANITMLESPVCSDPALMTGYGSGGFAHVRMDSVGGSWPFTLIKVAAMRETSLESPGDLNNDGDVGGADLAVLLGEWGICTGACSADLSGDGMVDGIDLAVLLGGWGVCSGSS